MHTYSIDKNLRSKVAIIIFTISMIISLILNNMFSGIVEEFIVYFENSKINNIIKLLEWLEASPNILGIPFWYGIITWLFDKYLWKLKLVKSLHGIPDLNGTWSGTLESSYDECKIPMEMVIQQTWSKIAIRSNFNKTNSYSYSNVAAIYVEGNNGVRIYFGFENESYNIKDKMQYYNGYNVLTLLDDNNIKAKYFNDRENPNPEVKGGNKGTFDVKREKGKKIEQDKFIEI